MTWNKWSERVVKQLAEAKALADALVKERDALLLEKERAAPVLVSAIEVGQWWRIQDGISALALEDLADAVKTYLGEPEPAEPER